VDVVPQNGKKNYYNQPKTKYEGITFLAWCTDCKCRRPTPRVPH